MEAFTSVNGSKFYKFGVNLTKISLVKKDFPVEFPNFINMADNHIKIFDPGFKLFWHLKNIPESINSWSQIDQNQPLIDH